MTGQGAAGSAPMNRGGFSIATRHGAARRVVGAGLRPALGGFETRPYREPPQDWTASPALPTVAALGACPASGAERRFVEVNGWAVIDRSYSGRRRVLHGPGDSEKKKRGKAPEVGALSS